MVGGMEESNQRDGEASGCDDLAQLLRNAEHDEGTIEISG